MTIENMLNIFKNFYAFEHNKNLLLKIDNDFYPIQIKEENRAVVAIYNEKLDKKYKKILKQNKYLKERIDQVLCKLKKTDKECWKECEYANPKSEIISAYLMKKQEKEQLEIDNYNLNANLQRLSDMLDEAKKIIKDLLMSESHWCTGEKFLEIRDKAEIFIRDEEKNDNRRENI